MTDWELLEQYRESNSQEAFAHLAERHVAWIHASARRQVRDEHLAEDVVQAVFLALSQQAHRLHEGAALSTWLFQVTRYASAAVLRRETRRKRREQQAAAMSAPSTGDPMTAAQWEQLSVTLDAAIARLRGDDQRAVLLRFYERKSYPEIASAIGVSEEAARKRTDRAVEKLRQMIGRQDWSFSVAALSGAMLNKVVGPAPPAVMRAALAAPNAPPSIAAITKGALQMMTFAKFKMPVAISAAAIVLVVGALSLLRAEPAAPTTAAATQPATPQAANEPTPKSVVIGAYHAAAAGDAKGLISRFETTTPAQAKTLEQITQLMTAADALSKAVSQKFGADMEQQFSQAIGSGVILNDVTNGTETITGNTATVDIGSGPGSIPLVKSGQTWKISAQLLQTLNVQTIRQLATKVPAITQLAKDVRDGKYKSMQEFQQAAGGLMQ